MYQAIIIAMALLDHEYSCINVYFVNCIYIKSDYIRFERILKRSQISVKKEVKYYPLTLSGVEVVRVK